MLRTQKEQNTNDRPDSSRHRRGAQNSMVSSALILGVLTGRDRSRAFARGAELILIPIAGFVISALCEAYGHGWRLAVGGPLAIKTRRSQRVAACPPCVPTSKTETQEQAHA
jgi:hypothetical protein